MPSAVIYARVSSEEQEKEGWSIPSQLKALRKLAVQNHYSVEAEFVESASAKNTGRKEFAEMVAFVQEHKIGAILCYKVDRLTRNPKDLITIEELGVDLIFVEGRYDSSPQGRFTLSMMASLARFQVENQALDIRRGMQEKVEQGGWPRRAPIGYWNDKNKSTVEVDEEKCFFIRQAFELYTRGGYSIKSLGEKLYETGFLNRGGKRVHPHGIETILKNPFYYGVMRYQGTNYPGNHTALISKELFDAVQIKMTRTLTANKQQKRFFPFRGYLVCGECGSAITAQVQKGHDYYNCTKSKGDCSQPFVRAELLEDQISSILEEIELDQELVEIMIDAAKEMKQEETAARKSAHKGLVASLDRIKDKEQKLLDAFLEGHIEPGIYKDKAAHLNEQRINLELQIARQQDCDDQIFELMKQVLLTAKAARNAFVHGDGPKKREILEIVASNLVLKGREIVTYQLKEPFSMLAKWPKNPDLEVMWRQGDSNHRPPGPKTTTKIENQGPAECANARRARDREVSVDQLREPKPPPSSAASKGDTQGPWKMDVPVKVLWARGDLNPHVLANTRS